MKMRLVDGVRMAKAHPKTFRVPSRQEKVRLNVGDYVKIGVFSPVGDRGVEHEEVPSAERLWFHITAKQGRVYRGVCHNYPLIVPIKYGDELMFEARHILDVIFRT